MKEDLLTIIKHYGIENQLKYIHSEYFELDEAILDYEQAGFDFSDEDCKNIEKEYKNHIIEELADIMVMLEQFRIYYGISLGEVGEIMNYKIKRQIERIEKE